MEVTAFGPDRKPIGTRSINNSEMTSECWTIQMWGPEACETCQYKGKRLCGGKTIRKTGKNSKGFTVPLGETI